LLIAVGALAVLVLEVGAAGASPATGPPIEPQSPGEGATVQASDEALKVGFTCPPFVYEAGELIEEEEIVPPPLPVFGVELQELRGTTWTKVAEAPGSNSGETNFYVKVKKPGRHTFRPVVTAGSMAGPLVLEEASKAVRKPTKVRVTGTAEDGAYVAANAKEREEWPIEMSVTGGGTALKNLKVEAETTCKGPTKAQDVKLEIPAVVKHAKFAPDGTVFGVTKTSGPEVWTVTLVGSFFRGRFQGELTTSRTNCTDYRTIGAVMKKTVEPSTKK
jgi:hypothetical protein